MEKTTMSVQELSAQMGISLPKAYELVKEPGFPTIKVGARILIPVEAFREWLMNDDTALHLRKLKDDDGNYLWNANTDSILGKPVVISEYMPDIEAGSKPVAFGDFSYYWIIDRDPASVQVLKELYLNTGHIGYLAYEFLDGKLIRSDAVKVISIGNSENV